MADKKHFTDSWFFHWLLDNKGISFLFGLLLLLLNIFLLYKVDFVFRPILGFIGVVLLPLVLSAIFFYLLNPIVDWAEKHRLPRTVTIAGLFILLAGLIVWGLAVIVPYLTNSAEYYIKNFPRFMHHSESSLTKLIEDFHLNAKDFNVDALVNNFGTRALDLSRSLYSTTVNGLGGFIAHATGIVVDILIFPFILFYLLRDGRQISDYITHFLPNAWRKDTAKLLKEINTQLASYIRGQIIVAISVSIMFSIGLSIIGLRNAIPIAILAGLFNLIPYLGSFLAFILAAILGIMISPLMFVKVVIVFIIEQTIEGRLISPLVLGSQLKIHPITILFILLTAASAFGVWGVFLGIPIYASIKVVASHFFDWYRQISKHYHENE